MSYINMTTTTEHILSASGLTKEQAEKLAAFLEEDNIDYDLFEADENTGAIVDAWGMYEGDELALVAFLEAEFKGVYQPEVEV